MSNPVASLATTPEAVAVGLLSLALVPIPSPADDPVLRLRASAVDASAGASARLQTLEIAIERWTSDDGLESRREVPRAGYIRGESGAGWDVQYARLQPLPDGGQRVVFATDRRPSVDEAARDSRTRERLYAVGEIWLGPDGKGVGALATAATEDAEPVRLSEVVVEGGRTSRP